MAHFHLRVTVGDKSTLIYDVKFHSLADVLDAAELANSVSQHEGWFYDVLQCAAPECDKSGSCGTTEQKAVVTLSAAICSELNLQN